MLHFKSREELILTQQMKQYKRARHQKKRTLQKIRGLGREYAVKNKRERKKEKILKIVSLAVGYQFHGLTSLCPSSLSVKQI